ncbi:MAG: RES domain-containing protein [Alphaproteobacteria bacterium]|nr:RES domain-containing protein [Alphaproteobacteria bacterium]
MQLFRVAAADAFADSSPKTFEGRWHLPGDRVIYFSLSPSSALNEFVAHAEMEAATLAAAKLTLWAYDAPDDLACDVIDPAALPAGWREDWALCQPHARNWHRRGAAALRAPSAIMPAETNLLVHPARLAAPFKLARKLAFAPDARLIDPKRRRLGKP